MHEVQKSTKNKDDFHDSWRSFSVNSFSVVAKKGNRITSLYGIEIVTSATLSTRELIMLMSRLSA